MEKRKQIGLGKGKFGDFFSLPFPCYYVDKTPFIKEAVESTLFSSAVNLILRPRRWGKTLNLSMLQSFFDIESADMKDVFASLAIGKDKAFCEQYENRFPVISITFKDVKGKNEADIIRMLNFNLADEYRRHAYVRESLSKADDALYGRFCDRTADEIDFTQYLSLLSSALYTYHHIKPLVLIDEYDVPLNSAHEGGFFDEFVPILSGMFSSGLKDNGTISGAVITGCLQIAKNSLFTGLNNLTVNTVSSCPRFGSAFGFTKAEVDEMLSYYGLADKRERIRDWYDGYLIGGVDIYNPFSVANAIADLTCSPDAKLKNYWANTSGDRLLRQMLASSQGNDSLRDKFQCLLAGKSVSGDADETMTYGTMLESERSIMGTLLFTGYLTEDWEGNLRIPNREVLSAFSQIVDLYEKDTMRAGGGEILGHLRTGNVPSIESSLRYLLASVISIDDMRMDKEYFMHGFLLGALTAANVRGGWEITSSREAGDGYADITIQNRNTNEAIIIEIKQTKDDAQMKALAESALKQIDSRRYALEFEQYGYRVHKYGISFSGKRVRVMASEH